MRRMVLHGWLLRVLGHFPISIALGSAQTETEGTSFGDDEEDWRGGKLQPGNGNGVDKPADKHGSEVADRSLMTPARKRTDLD